MSHLLVGSSIPESDGSEFAVMKVQGSRRRPNMWAVNPQSIHLLWHVAVGGWMHWGRKMQTSEQTQKFILTVGSFNSFMYLPIFTISGIYKKTFFFQHVLLKRGCAQSLFTQ
jgi:hypothetical protein